MRLRMSVRTLMIATALFACALGLGLAVESGFGVVRVTPNAAITLVFRVIDAESGRPIVPAYLLLVEPGHADEPPVSPYHLEFFSDEKGRAAATIHVSSVEEMGYLTGRRLRETIAYPRWEILVAADGYEEYRAPFASLESRFPRFHQPGVAASPILIRLRREGPATDALENGNARFTD